MAHPAILIIAYGNPIRQDDGAGLRLAEVLADQFRSRGVAVDSIAVQQLMPELAVDIADASVSAVVFVDTRDATGEPGRPEVDRRPVSASTPSSPSLGHHLDPAALLAYAGLLDQRPAPTAWLVTAPGVEFGLGEGLSETASAALARAGCVAEELLADQFGPFQTGNYARS